jgi:hypothetical protein
MIGSARLSRHADTGRRYRVDLQLAGIKALVTGGTRGIGRAVVETFLEEGANVAFCARNEAEVRTTTADLAGRGATVFGAIADVGDATALTSWVADAAAALGGVDIVVSNVSALAIPDTPDNWEASPSGRPHGHGGPRSSRDAVSGAQPGRLHRHRGECVRS